MDSIIPFSHFSIIIPSKLNNSNIALRFRPWKQTASSHSTPIRCHKMFVPGFGEASPENKAAKHLHDFFTYVAVKIVNAQLECFDGFYSWFAATAQSYNPEAYADLMQFVETHSLEDGDKFCAELMRESPSHKSLALRILEVRSAYCKTDFEWDNLQRLSSKMVEDSNTRLMRDYVSETSSVKDEP